MTNERVASAYALMDQYVKEAGRPCSVATWHKPDEETPLLHSRFLGDVMMPDWMPWPQYQGRYMTALMQVNLNEVPFVPEPMAGYDWMTFFVDLEELHHRDKHEDGWAVYFYETLDLRKRDCPQPQTQASRWETRVLKWHHAMDILPIRSEYPEVLPPQWRDFKDQTPQYVYSDLPHGQGKRHHVCTKLGGFPSYRQGEFGASHPEHFIFQLCYHNDWDTGFRFDRCDCAIEYVGHHDDMWIYDWQTS